MKCTYHVDVDTGVEPVASSLKRPRKELPVAVELDYLFSWGVSVAIHSRSREAAVHLTPYVAQANRPKDSTIARMSIVETSSMTIHSKSVSD
jgi:hypothetical protein